MFNANPALKIAFLSHNEVDAIEDSLLQNKSELKRVDLGDNGFESVGDIFEVSKYSLWLLQYEPYNESLSIKIDIIRALFSFGIPYENTQTKCKDGAGDVNFHWRTPIIWDLLDIPISSMQILFI